MQTKIRKAVYDKYNGHCAYCGCEISYKEMQVDHIVPKCRNNESIAERIWNGGGEDSIENYNPSCRMCNFYKGMQSVEGFRKRIIKELDYKHTFATRMALRYGILVEQEWDKKFYFEKLNSYERK